MRQRIVAVTTRPEFWLLALLCWLLLSAGRSLETPWARVALTEALRWSAGIGLALALGLLLRHTRLAARFVVTLAGAVALLGMADGLRPGGGGLTGPYQDHQLYGSVLLLLLPPAVAVALTAHDFRWRLGGIAASGVGALCLALSQTRSAWAGALVAALVFGGLWLFRSGSRRRAGRSVLITAAALVGALLALWLLLAPLDLRAPLTARVGTLSTLSVDQSWQERLTIWRGASRLVAAHPLYGIGLGRYPGTQWVWTQAGHPLEPSERPSLSEEAHDFYLQTAAETGLIGLGLYVMALSAFVFQGMRRLGRARRHRSASHDALIIASLSLVAGQAVDALASPSWQFGEASFFFWALLGLGMAAMRREEPEAAAVRVPLLLRRAGRLALSGGVAVTLAANVLPLGLLTPVEAYTHANNVSLQSTRVAQTMSNCPAGSVCFKLTAVYSDGSTQDVTFDNESHGTASFFACAAPSKGGGKCTSSFGTVGTRNQLVVAASERNMQVNINGGFSDITFTPPSTYTPVFNGKNMAPAISVTLPP